MDNVQNCDSYINKPSSPTFRRYVLLIATRIMIIDLWLPSKVVLLETRPYFCSRGLYPAAYLFT
jgi:hypothetical protein